MKTSSGKQKSSKDSIEGLGLHQDHVLKKARENSYELKTRNCET
jgi:hypothetical protein